MDKQLMYLCAVITVGWSCFFVYLFILDAKMRDIKKRLAARETSSDK